MLKAKALELLKKREFVSVATADFKGMPNAAPKFLLKVEGNFVYLVDYTIGRTWKNININPRVSLSFIDSDTLLGYQLNGSVDIIDKRQEYDSVLKEMADKKINLSTKRIIEGISRGKAHQFFELAISERFIVFKVRIEEVVEICPCGKLKREKL